MCQIHCKFILGTRACNTTPRAKFQQQTLPAGWGILHTTVGRERKRSCAERQHLRWKGRKFHLGMHLLQLHRLGHELKRCIVLWRRGRHVHHVRYDRDLSYTPTKHTAAVSCLDLFTFMMCSYTVCGLTGTPLHSRMPTGVSCRRMLSGAPDVAPVGSDIWW